MILDAYRFGAPPAPVAVAWNPADKAADVTLSNSDRTATHTFSGNRCARAVKFVAAGKVYLEISGAWNNNAAWAGLCTASAGLAAAVTATDGVVYLRSGAVYVSGSSVATVTSSNGSHVIMFALDLDADKAWVGRNGTWFSGDPAAGTGGYTVPAGTFAAMCNPRSDGLMTLRSLASGADALAYAAPSGFTAYAAA